MASAGTVTADFEARSAKFAAELEKVRRDLGKLKDQGEVTAKALKSLTSFASDFKSQIVGLVSAGALISFAQQAFEAADAIGDAAARSGIAVEDLSRLKFAAEQNDVQFESLTRSIKDFQKNLSAAGSGTDSAREKFALLGLEAEQLRGLRIDEQLGTIADRFRTIVDPADQTRIAVELFGKAGAELIPLLNQGSEGIAELTAEADRLGITLNTTTAAGIGAADSALKKLSATVSGFFQRRLGQLALNLVGTDDVDAQLQLRLEELDRRRDELENSVVAVGEFVGVVDNKEAIDEINQQIAQVQDQILGRQLETRLRETVTNVLQNTAAEVQGALGALAVTGDSPDVNLPQQGDGSRFIDLDPITRNEQTLALISEQTLEALTLDFENFQLFEQLKTDIARESALDRLEIQESALAAENSLREAVAFNAVNLLNTLGAKNKAFAIAAIAIQKFRAVQETLLASKTAAMLAYASQLVPGDPTSLVRAQAAYTKTIALGKINAALIVAGGVLDVANVLSGNRGGIGNTGLGTPSNPLPVIPGGDATGAERGATNIYVTGYIGKDMVDELVRALRDEADRDVVIFPAGSRQAIEIRAGS
jgi:hypothetical protein